MNHSARYQRELEGKAAKWSAAQEVQFLEDAITGALNMAKWEQKRGDEAGFWGFINTAYEFTDKLEAITRQDVEDTRGLLLGL